MSDIITNIEQLDPINGVYTYADYVLWKIKDRLEILKGKIFRLDTPMFLIKKYLGICMVRCIIISKENLANFLQLLLM